MVDFILDLKKLISQHTCLCLRMFSLNILGDQPRTSCEPWRRVLITTELWETDSLQLLLPITLDSFYCLYRNWNIHSHFSSVKSSASIEPESRKGEQNAASSAATSCVALSVNYLGGKSVSIRPISTWRIASYYHFRTQFCCENCSLLNLLVLLFISRKWDGNKSDSLQAARKSGLTPDCMWLFSDEFLLNGIDVHL